MLKIENTETFGWEAAIRGMRNAMNSWDKSDSWWASEYETGTDECMYILGENDLKLAQSLVAAGSDHRKFLRMIHVQMDVTAPLYWWKEFDTYKVGTVANSCSTMHKIAGKEFTMRDFSFEHLISSPEMGADEIDIRISPVQALLTTIECLNGYRNAYLKAKENRDDEFTIKLYWWQLIQLLPSSYNQRRTLDLNYEVLRNIYHARRNHKLDCWVQFCQFIETLPYAKELMCGSCPSAPSARTAPMNAPAQRTA